MEWVDGLVESGVMINTGCTCSMFYDTSGGYTFSTFYCVFGLMDSRSSAHGNSLGNTNGSCSVRLPGR